MNIYILIIDEFENNEPVDFGFKSRTDKPKMNNDSSSMTYISNEQAGIRKSENITRLSSAIDDFSDFPNFNTDFSIADPDDDDDDDDERLESTKAAQFKKPVATGTDDTMRDSDGFKIPQTGKSKRRVSFLQHVVGEDNLIRGHDYGDSDDIHVPSSSPFIKKSNSKTNASRNSRRSSFTLHAESEDDLGFGNFGDNFDVGDEFEEDSPELKPKRKTTKKQKTRRISFKLDDEDLSSDRDADGGFRPFDDVEDPSDEDEDAEIPKNSRGSRSSSLPPKPQKNGELPLKVYEKGGLHEIRDENGIVVRRSSRMRYQPLEYWRNERVVFGRRESGPFPVPVIKDIIRVPKAAEKRKKTQRKRKYPIKSEIRFVDPMTSEEVEHPLVASSTNLEFKEVKNAEYKVATMNMDPTSHRLFSVVLMFPKGTKKPLRSSGDITMVGFVLTGEIEVTIHRTTFKLSRGGSFVVPKENLYGITNIGSREARVYLVNESGSG